MSSRLPRAARTSTSTILRSPRTRVVALIAVTGLAGCFAIAGAGGGAAAATQYRSRSVGNFLDATIAGTPLDQVAALKYATAQSPGTASAQNPLDATALGAIDLPLTDAVKLPSFGGIDLGAVNQVARAKPDGSSLGASGAVANSGGVSVGGDDSAYPSSATISLDAGDLLGTSPIALPGGSSQTSLGGISLSVHGVSGIAATDDTSAAVTPKYTIADLDLTLDSPALGALLGQLTTALNANPLTTTLNSTLGSLLNTLHLPLGSLSLPSACTLTSEGLGSTLSLEGGAVKIDASTGSIALNLRKLLTKLGLDLDTLPANTDLTSYLLDYLTSATGLTQGVEGVIDGLVDGLENQFSACETALGALDPTHLLGGLLSQLTGALDSGRSQFEGLVNDLVGTLSGVGGTGNPLSPIGDALANVIDIGVNVQHGPGAAASNTDDRFTSALDNTPKQGTPVVPHQTLVRALEIDLLNVDSSTVQSGGTTGTPGVVLALGNAAAGPSTRIATTPTSAPPTTVNITTTPTKAHTTSTTAVPVDSTVPNTYVPPLTTYPSNAMPNAVPAGDAGHRTSGSALPLTVVLLGLLVGLGAVYGLRRHLVRTHR